MDDTKPHEPTLRAVIAAFRARSDEYDRSTPQGRALADEQLAMARILTYPASPPAKPEAKLEALPTESDWSLMLASGGATGFTYPGNERVNALARAILCGGVKIVDERGKGAEAERLAPCPVCGVEPILRVPGGTVHWYDYCCFRNQPRIHGLLSRGRPSEPDARKEWNEAFGRAERFPGER